MISEACKLKETWPGHAYDPDLIRTLFSSFSCRYDQHGAAGLEGGGGMGGMDQSDLFSQFFGGGGFFGGAGGPGGRRESSLII
jgi:hypothetical protein